MTNKHKILALLLTGTFLSSPAMAELSLPGGEYGKGVHSVYLRWDGTAGKKQLVVTDNKSEADITVKYGKEKYDETFKDLSKEFVVETTDPSQIYSHLGIYNYPKDGATYDKKVNNALFDNNRFEGQNSVNGKHLYFYGTAFFNEDADNLGDITADFTNNLLKGTSATNNRMRVYGGAIVNENISGALGNISGDFINNRAEAYGSQSSAHGGAVFNYYSATIKDIEGNFVNNSAVGNYAVDGTTYLAAGGGAIWNQEKAKINNITGNFINNTATTQTKSAFGGAIYNTSSSSIQNIKGDFIGNKVHAAGSLGYGGAIYNYNKAEIKDINGNFIGNSADSTDAQAASGAIYNDASSLGKVTGDFIGNHADSKTSSKIVSAMGGAVTNVNSSSITSLNGNFIGNYVNGTYYVYGGAIANMSKAVIDNINGKFIDNYAQGKENAFGGAVFNNGSTIKNIQSDFSGNRTKAEHAYGGAIYTSAPLNIKNSSFTDNHAENSQTGYGFGGAIYSAADLSITADKATSLFSGNTADGKPNAIYISGKTPVNLNLTAVNNGLIQFDDPIKGKNYNLVLNGDNNGIIKFNETVTGANNFSMTKSAIAHLGLNADIQAKDMFVGNNENVTGISPIITVDVKVLKDMSTVKTGTIHISNDVKGDYRVLVNALNPDVLDNKDDAIVPFLFAPDDDKDTPSSFSVARVYGSPYLWTGDINAKGEETGSVWYLNLTDIVNPDYKAPDKEPEKAPEVDAGTGLHEAALEQTRSVVRNVGNKVAAGRAYCPGCGLYDYNWDGKELHNIWVLAQGENATIDKPVKMDADIWGVEAGFDVQNDAHNTLGVFASYRKGDYDLKAGDIDIDSYLAGLYYRYDKNMNWLFATVYGGIQRADVQTDDGIAKFDTDGIEFGAAVEAGHSYVLSDKVTLSPNFGIYYTQVNFDDANDNVGKKYSWDDIKHLEAELGVKLERGFDNSKIYFEPSVIRTLTGSDKVKISGLNEVTTYKDQTLGRVELGGNYGFTDALHGYAWTNYTFGSNYEATAFGLGINYAW